MNLTAIQMLVLAKLKYKAPELIPGTYPFDFTARFSGTVEVNEPEDYTPTVNLSLYEVLTLALIGAGVTEESLPKVAATAARQILAGRVPKRQAEAVKAAVEDTKDKFQATLGKEERAGKTKVSANVEAVKFSNPRIHAMAA